MQSLQTIKNPGFLVLEDHLLSTLKLQYMHCDCFKIFEKVTREISENNVP